MGFSVDMLRGGAGVVDHQLSRRALINEVKRGRVSKDSVCDAHPELIRAAKNIGEPSKTLCPICEEVNVALVTYVFGHGLPKNGKCVIDRKDIMHTLSMAPLVTRSPHRGSRPYTPGPIGHLLPHWGFPSPHLSCCVWQIAVCNTRVSR